MPGQLDLFKSKRQRGTKLPPAIERRVHIAVADAIRVSIVKGWVIFHVPNGELREVKTAQLLQRMLVMPGVADFIAVGPPQGRFHALELKRQGKRPSDHQNAFLEAVRAAGGAAAWADTFDGAIEILKGWGAIRARLS